MAIKMLYIPDSEVARLLTLATARRVVIETLAACAEGSALLSEPRSQFLRSKTKGSSFHVKGAALEAASIAGFRIGGFPRPGLDRTGTQLMVLSDLDSAVPIALLATDTLTGIRVGAALAVTIEWLRPRNARTLALVGTGKLARAAAHAIQATTPFEVVRVVGRSTDGARRLCDALLSEGIAGPEPSTSLEAACAGADVILTLTSADAPLIRAAWCKPDSLLVSAGGGRECEPAAILGADKLFVDDWAQCTVLGDLAALHRDGLVDETAATGTLADVVSGRMPGRQAGERIAAIPQGLTVLDIALAHRVYLDAAASETAGRLSWP